MLLTRLVYERIRKIKINHPIQQLQELQNFIKNKPADGFSSSESKKTTLNFLCQSLRTVRVATCKILQLLPPFIADEIYHTVLSELLVHMNVDKCNQFLAILMNGQFSAALIERFEVEIFPQLITALGANKDIGRQFKLCLAFDDAFRDRFLSVEDRLCAVDLVSKRRVFVLAVIEKQHFVEQFIKCDDVTISMLSNDVLRSTLILIQLLLKADQSIDHKPFLQEINQLPLTVSKNRLRLNVFNELQRLLNLKELFSSHIPTIRMISFAPKFNVIDMLYENVNLSKVDSRSVHSMLEENAKYNQRLDLRGNESVDQLTELELYNNFLIVKLLLEVIMDHQNVTELNESSVDKLSKVKMFLHQAESITARIHILETAFSLIFIRWDNLSYSGESIDSDRIVEESKSESNKSRKCSNRSERSTFICSAVVLDTIVKLLKHSAAETFHSKSFADADDSARKTFLQLQNNINDAHWRVALFSTNATVSGSRSTSFANDDVRKYFTRHKSHARDNSNGSSDDESNTQPKSSIYRRKPRKKNPLRKSIDDKNLVISNSTEHEQRSDALQRSISGSERRCPISRLLGSAGHLATVCLNNGKFEATKDIVEVRNLFKKKFGLSITTYL